MSENETGRVWRRAEECESAHCVEVCFDGPEVLVRNSNDPGGALLRFDRDEWRVFCAAVAGGQLRD
jgi:hypothetical protein